MEEWDGDIPNSEWVTITPYKMNAREKCVFIFNSFFKLIYYIAFIWVSYGVFQVCRQTRHCWIGVDILNGICGGILLVYPFSVFKNGLITFYNWWYYFLICALLCGVVLIISGLLGWSQ